MPAWKRGFCRRMPDSNVEPDRGSPEMKWKVWDVMAPLAIRPAVDTQK
jgi:hypothetical protein